MRPTLRVVRRASPRRRALSRSAGFDFFACRQLRFALREVAADGLGGGVSERHVALLAAFTSDQDDFVGPVDVGEVKAG